MHRFLYCFFFLLACLPTLLSPALSSWVSLSFFPPYLLMILYKKGLSKSIVQAFFCGLIVDLLTASTPIGFWVLIFILTLFFINRIKHFFFAEKWMTWPFLTLIFSQISTLLYFALLNIFCTKTYLSVQWALTDLIVLPCLDGLFALLFFSIPYHFLSKLLPEARRQTSSLNLKEN